MKDSPDPVQTIGKLVAELLPPYIGQEYEQDIIQRVHELFSEMAVVSGFDEHHEWMLDKPTSSGIAISSNEAALCLLDFRRTSQFLRGIHQAIRDAQRLFPGETIEVLYAGCGPYAPFLTLTATLFSPGEVRFTLLEINPESLAAAKVLVNEMDQGSFLRASHLADATTFQVPAAKDYHILFTETMDAVLEREPMVPILLNLLPQMREDVLVVPRNVTIEGVFFKESDLSKGMDGLWDLDCEDEGHSVGTVMDMAGAIKKHLADEGPGEKVFQLSQCPMPEPGQRGFFALFTTVDIWEDIVLIKNESDITDLRVRKLDDLPPSDFMNFEYQFGEEPRLMFGVS